ncbi:MAG TPA: DUF4129 domain-containing protein [Chryseosolibacter sp.]|nr:DUF4129 domain-containing protein [Chryseosolibacter sp.]
MRKMFFAVSLLVCLYLPAYAQEDSESEAAVLEEFEVESADRYDHELVPPQELETSVEYRSEELKVTEFDERKWKAIVKGVDFGEEQEEETEKKKDKESSAPWGGPVLKIISFAVIAALLIVIIYYVTRVISFDAKIERTTLDTDNLEAPVEDIAELNIAQLLDQAKREGNYKLAVRLYYLDLLKKLNDKGVIVWKKDKTNRDYLGELLSASYFFNEVRRLTLSYEAVWYGDHDLTPETFQFLTIQFENIYGKMNTNEKA